MLNDKVTRKGRKRRKERKSQQSWPVFGLVKCTCFSCSSLAFRHHINSGKKWYQSQALMRTVAAGIFACSVCLCSSNFKHVHGAGWRDVTATPKPESSGAGRGNLIHQSSRCHPSSWWGVGIRWSLWSLPNLAILWLWFIQDNCFKSFCGSVSPCYSFPLLSSLDVRTELRQASDK